MRHDIVPTSTGFHDEAGTITHDDLARDAFALRARIPEGGTAAVRSTRAVAVAAAFRALDGWASEVALVAPDVADAVPSAQVFDDLLEIGRGADSRGSTHAPPEDRRTRWVMFTSGTTGEPKRVEHTSASLTRTVRPGAGRRGRRWGLLYQPTRMAGVQVVLQALVAGEDLVDPHHLERLADRVGWLARHEVDALSATPTMWRQILQTPGSSGMPLRQITLGGEIADQMVLDALRRAFPESRITHVFAATETGAAFAVNDGREGFPRAYLDEAPGGIRLAIRDDRLYVHAPAVSTAEDDGFVCTGDVVEVVGDRVRFLGRDTGVANVGGVKVWPEQVESLLRRHPDVSDAVVTARKNAFSGTILAAEVVASPGVSTEGLPKRLRAWCAETVESAAVPAVVKLVPELTTTATGKAGRR